MTALDQVVADLRQAFIKAELSDWETPGEAMNACAALTLSAVGTIAPTAVKSPALLAAASADGGELRVGIPHTTVPDLLADDSWQLAIVLSPNKRDVLPHVDALTPAAIATGVVDTVVRRRSGTVGVNTNVYGAGAALARFVTPVHCDRIAIVGTGASARSVAIACQRYVPDSDVVLIGRSPERTATAAAELQVPVGAADDRADVLINTTSWGETDASEQAPLGVDLDPLLTPGTVVFDINNRVSTLKQIALERGCVVIPGTLMQRLVNALRVTLALRVAGAG